MRNDLIEIIAAMIERRGREVASATYRNARELPA
jgi:hypothetical protein